MNDKQLIDKILKKYTKEYIENTHPEFMSPKSLAYGYEDSIEDKDVMVVVDAISKKVREISKGNYDNDEVVRNTIYKEKNNE